MHVNWDPASQAKLKGDLGAARALEMQCVGPPVCGHALALTNLAPVMGQIASLPCDGLFSQRLWEKTQTENRRDDIR